MHKKAEDEVMDSITRILVWWGASGLALFVGCWLWNHFS